MEPDVPANTDGAAAKDADAMIAVLRETVVLLRRALTRLLGEDEGDDYALTSDRDRPTESVRERNAALHRLSGQLLGRIRPRS